MSPSISASTSLRRVSSPLISLLSAPASLKLRASTAVFLDFCSCGSRSPMDAFSLRSAAISCVTPCASRTAAVHASSALASSDRSDASAP